MGENLVNARVDRTKREKVALVFAELGLTVERRKQRQSSIGLRPIG